MTNLPALPLHTNGSDILDSNNLVRYLRGPNYPSGFTASCVGSFPIDGDWIWGYCYTQWNGPQGGNVGAPQRFAELENAGMNHIRLIFNIDWMRNNSSTNLNSQSTDIPIRSAILNTIHVAADYGIYVVIAPYPPGNPANYFSSASSFASFWGEMAQLYGSEPNAVFELWGEPSEGDYSAWINQYCPQATAAIRQYTSTPVIIQWGYCGSFGFADDAWDSCGQYGNIIMSNHIYRYPPGATMTTSETTTAQIINSLNNNWDYDTVTGIYPAYIGEIGCWIDYGSGERTWFSNALNEVLNEWDYSYSAWQWGQGTGWSLNNSNTAPFGWGATNVNGGVIFRDAVLAGGVTGSGGTGSGNGPTGSTGFPRIPGPGIFGWGTIDWRDVVV